MIHLLSWAYPSRLRVVAGDRVCKPRLGNVLAFTAGGGIIYAMIQLLALARLSGAVNIVADSLLLVFTLVALWQVGARVRQGAAG